VVTKTPERDKALNPSELSALNDRFAIPGIAQIVAGNGGLAKLRITTSAAAAEIYLHGGQVTSWRPAGAEEVLFVSRQSRWEDGRAIRGGIPICFPWFRGKADNPQAPAHGVVRTKAWQLDALTEDRGSVTVTLSTTSDETSRRWWPHEFHIAHRVTVSADLRLELIVSNNSSLEDAEPMRFEQALHTYHAVADAASVRVSGLDEVAYLDNVDANREKMQHGDVIYCQPTDSAYLDTVNTVELIDPGLRRRIRTAKHNSLTTVVWNPWKEGAAALADLADTEWQQMACVEASNIMDYAVTLAPGKQHTMAAILSLESEQDWAR
jgi:glucose-6-phosphate 1-epimerase